MEIFGWAVVGRPVHIDANEESEAWQREPIARFEAYLLAQKLATDADLTARHAAAKARIEQAIQFAEESPLPDAASVAQGVFA